MSDSKERLLQISNNNAHCPATHECRVLCKCMHVSTYLLQYINIDRSLQTFFSTDRLDPEAYLNAQYCFSFLSKSPLIGLLLFIFQMSKTEFPWKRKAHLTRHPPNYLKFWIGGYHISQQWRAHNTTRSAGTTTRAMYLTRLTRYYKTKPWWIVHWFVKIPRLGHTKWYCQLVGK